MGKTRLTLTAHRKKRRLNPALVQYNAKRRAEKTEGESSPQPLRELQNLVTASEPKSRRTKLEPLVLTGRRIVNISDLFDQLKSLNSHSPIGCTLSNMEVISKKRQGLKSSFVFQCNMCNLQTTVCSERNRENVMDVNSASVCGTVSTGGGHSQMEEFLGVLNIPQVTNKTFKKYEEKVSLGWAATAAKEMEEAAEEEARLARQHGEIDKDGVPLITVVADGAWCKRSYRTNYSSLSGVAAIVGYRTRKVLFIGVKNKYCTSCARAETKTEPPKEHTCYKNWRAQQSSTSMEAAIICEGFQKSEDMYGLRYAKLIADGDSSVYKKILENRPYKFFTVEKVECKNHLLRNMCTRLKNLTTSKTQKASIIFRKKLGDNIMRCRTAVAKATEHRRNEDAVTSQNIENLRQDLLNIPSHVFGEHKECSKRGYFCQLDTKTAPKESNIVPGLVSVGLYPLIMDVFRDLSRHSRSLLADVTSNYMEHYNSIVAKFIGGKRINFAASGSYKGHCSAAVVQHNTGLAHYKLHKTLYKTSPGIFSKSMESRRKKKIELQREKKRCKKSLFPKSKNEEKDYGLAAQRPDIDEATMNLESSEFLKSLQRSEEELERIQMQTVLQSDSSEWLELRRNILTASNFGRICKMRPTTGCQNIVKQLLYSTFDCVAMEYGRRNEETARSELEAQIGKPIAKCGLFINKDYPFLGASPDGLISDDAVVEIKCPSSAKDMTPDEAIKKRKFTFWTVDKNGEVGEIQKTHNFYYQIQGQLQVTKRKYCTFAMWTPKGLKTTTVERDEKFWAEQMFSKLEAFYMDCLLPEIINPRHNRSMPIRNPHHIIEAQKKAAEKKSQKNFQMYKFCQFCIVSELCWLNCYCRVYFIMNHQNTV